MTGRRILHRNDRLVSLGQGDRYRLIRLVAEDSLGQVWQSEDSSLRAPVTIRVVDGSLTKERARVGALRRELSAMYARLAHPNIAWVYYYNEGEDGPVEFVVMEDLRGQPLAQRLRRGPALRPREGFGIAAAIADGLQAAHDVGLAHGALTADSVMLNGGGSVKIMDFGLAELRREEPEPEGPAGDVRALVTLLRQMSGARSAGVPSGDLRSRPGVRVDVLRLWQASLDPDPAMRPTAEALARAFREAAEPGAVPGAAESAVGSTPELEGPVLGPVLETGVDEPSEPEPRRFEPATEASVSGAAVKEGLEVEPAEEGPQAKGDRRGTEEARALVEAAGEARRRAKAAPREAKAVGAEAERRAEQLERAEDAVRSPEAASQEAANGARGAAAGHERTREALAHAETEHAERARVVARAEEIARREDERRKEAIVRAKGAAQGAEEARAAASAARVDNSAGPRRRAGPGSPRTVAPGPNPSGRRSLLGFAEGTPSFRGALPQRRTWLGLVGLTVATSLLVFLLTRPDDEPVTRSGPGIAPGSTATTESLTMPDLRGMTYDEALLQLKELDLALARRVRAQGEPGVVVATDPGLGHLVRPGTEITVFVGAGPAADALALATF